MPVRKGFLSKEEKDFIRDNATKMRTEEIASNLNRSVKIVADYIKQHLSFEEPKTTTVPPSAYQSENSLLSDTLKSSENWKRLKSELMPDEIKFFEEKYVGMMKQFNKDGILATEESQIIQAIKFEVLMSRNLVERRRSREDIERLQNSIKRFLDSFGGDTSLMNDQQREFLMNMETQLQGAKQAEQARTSEYVKLQERLDSLMKNLKGTRDQRIKSIENSRTSYIGIIKELQNKEILEKEGRFAELYKLAGKASYEDLAKIHKYEDGQIDRPILSEETVDV